MSAPGSEVRRILLALDAITPLPRLALESAGELAARLSAELSGLFVEDLDLVRSAHAFATTIDLLTASPLATDSSGLERTLHSLAQAAEQEMAGLAERQRLRWSFRTVRGRPGQVLARETVSSDLVVLPNARGRLAGRRGLALPEIRSSARSLLLMRPETRSVPPVLVGWDGTPAAQRALALARALAGDADGALGVVLLADTPERAAHLADALELVLDRHRPARRRALPPRRLDRLVELAATLGCGLVVLPDPGGDIELPDASMPCSVLLVQ